MLFISLDPDIIPTKLSSKMLSFLSNELAPICYSYLFTASYQSRVMLFPAFNRVHRDLVARQSLRQIDARSTDAGRPGDGSVRNAQSLKNRTSHPK